MVTGSEKWSKTPKIAVLEDGGEALPTVRMEFVGQPPTKTTVAIMHFLAKAAYRDSEIRMAAQAKARKVHPTKGTGVVDAPLPRPAYGMEHSVPMSELMDFLTGGHKKRVRVEAVHKALSDALKTTTLRFHYTELVDGTYRDRVREANVFQTITMGDQDDVVTFRLNADIEPILLDPLYYHFREDRIVTEAPSTSAIVLHDLWASELRGKTKKEIEYTTTDLARLIGHSFDPSKGVDKGKLQERHVAPALVNTNKHSALIAVNQLQAPTGFRFEVSSKTMDTDEHGTLRLGKGPTRRAAQAWRESGLEEEERGQLGEWWIKYNAYYSGLQPHVKSRLDSGTAIARDFVGFVRHTIEAERRKGEETDPAWVPRSAVLRVGTVYGKRMPHRPDTLVTAPGGGLRKNKHSVTERLLTLWHAVVREARADETSVGRLFLKDMITDCASAFQRVCAIDHAQDWAALKRVEHGFPAMIEYPSPHGERTQTQPVDTGEFALLAMDPDERDRLIEAVMAEEE
jgi:hypothetical protein